MLFDGDSDCPAELGPAVQGWATEAAGEVPCAVVIAHREYQAWILAAIDSLRGHRNVRSDAEAHRRPENPRGAKEQFELRVRPGSSYIETTDQSAFSARLSLSAAYCRSRSFRKLASSFGNLARLCLRPTRATLWLHHWLNCQRYAETTCAKELSEAAPRTDESSPADSAPTFEI